MIKSILYNWGFLATLPPKEIFSHWFQQNLGGTGGSDGKEPACNAGNLGSNPGLGRSPGEGNDNPLQY